MGRWRFCTHVVLAGVLAILVAPSAIGQTSSATSATSPPRTSWGAPDLQGVWSSSTVTPMERPADLADKEFLSEEEAAEYSRQQVEQRNTDIRRTGVRDVTSAYNDHWYDRGTAVIPTRRTSLVVDPPDGRIPELTEEARARVARSIPYSGYQDGRHPGTWLERGLWERCITRGVPNVMLPTAYNNYYQVFQTPDHVVILAEMIHDVRIIPIDGPPALEPPIRQWMGDARGHWEGDTLVVETRNFTDKTSYRGAADNLHLVERFTRLDPETLLYEVTLDDPTAFTRSWTVALPATAADGPIYEYACHEGNYSMANTLSGTLAITDEPQPK
jgi:hypothetical protein